MNKENHRPLPITIHPPIYLHPSPQPPKSQNELSQHPTRPLQHAIQPLANPSRITPPQLNPPTPIPAPQSTNNTAPFPLLPPLYFSSFGSNAGWSSSGPEVADMPGAAVEAGAAGAGSVVSTLICSDSAGVSVDVVGGGVA